MNLRTLAGALLLVVASAIGMVFAANASATFLTSPTGTTYTSTLKASAEGHVVLHNPIGKIECASSLEGKVESHGAGKAASGSVSSLSFSSCTNEWHVTVVATGTFSVESTSGYNGTARSNGATVEATRFGITCRYATGNTSIGTLTGGSTATLDISASIPFHSGSIFCGTGGSAWTGAYIVNTPDSLYVDAGEGSSPTSTSLTTSLSGEGKSGEAISVSEGSKVKDTATLSGTNASKATGTVKYKVYADKECKELVTSAGEVEVKEGKVPDSSEVELTAGAIYYWQAEYSGDSNNLKSTSTCGKEVLTVKAATSLTTSLSGEEQTGTEIEVQEEVPVTDKATLSGTNSSKATGSVEYEVYADEECKELVTEAGKVTVTVGSVPSSSEVKLADGIYYWQAAYGGDATHLASTAVCGSEIEIVAAATTLTTSLMSAGESGKEIEVEEGEIVSDTATLSGANAAEATGKVQYSVYEDGECSELVAEAGTVDLFEEGVVPGSSPAMLPPGTYYWQAEYLGDLHNQRSTSTCGDEVLVVKAPPLTTSLSGEEQTGTEIEVQEETPVTDAATLNIAGAGTATGTVKYKVYSDSECKELAASAGEVSVTGGVVPNSSEVALPAGVYYWQAEYSGDMSHPAATSACGDEIEIVAAATSLSTSLSGGEETGPEIEVRAGTAVSDTATLSGATASEATGTVLYSIYEDSECEELFQSAGAVEVTTGTVPESQAVPLPAGTYYWQAHYFGDEGNQGSVSPCGGEVANVGPARLTNDLAGGEEEGAEIEVPEETQVTDTATLNIASAGTATGTVKYNVYSDPECKELAASAGEVSVSGGIVPPSSEEELPQGIYYWQAEYSGDETHEAATSPCGEAAQRVEPPYVISVGDSFSSGEGGAWAGNVLDLVFSPSLIDVWRGKAYLNPLNGEGKKEEIPGCHRSRAAEIFIGVPDTKSWNIACSGARTASFGIDAVLVKRFKPGLDFASSKEGKFVYPDAPERGRCPQPLCTGQALILQTGAENIKKRNEKIKMVVISIGGNDFGFGAVVASCFATYAIEDCGPQEQPRFEAKWTVPIQANIKAGIENIGQAVVAAGFAKKEFTLLVQNYPSLIPPKANGFRYQGAERVLPGRCAFRDNDIEWANNTALAKINETVKKATEEAAKNYTVEELKIEGAFNGRRLCETNLELVGPLSKTRDWQQVGAVDRSEWVNQVRVATAGTPFSFEEDFHPNYWGQLALRNCVRQAYNNGAPKGGTCVIAGMGLSKPVNAPRDWREEPKMKLEP